MYGGTIKINRMFQICKVRDCRMVQQLNRVCLYTYGFEF